MKVRAPLAAVALSLTALAAQADTVQLVFDVLATSRLTGATVNGEFVQTADPLFQPQRFSYTLSFDLDAELLFPTETSLVDDALHVRGNYASGPSSQTPFTAAVLAGAPDPAGAVVSHDGLAYYDLSVPASATAQAPQPVAQVIGLNSLFIWTGGDEGSGFSAYTRGIQLASTGPSLGREQLGAWTPADMLASMQGQIGKTQSDAFLESFEVSGLALGPDGSLGLNRQNLEIHGDAVLRSITSVPEPATFALMGIGLVGLAGVARRRAVQQR